MNGIGSFFSCLNASASLSRSLIQDATGGKTQVSATLMLISQCINTVVPKIGWLGLSNAVHFMFETVDQHNSILCTCIY